MDIQKNNSTEYRLIFGWIIIYCNICLLYSFLVSGIIIAILNNINFTNIWNKIRRKNNKVAIEEFKI